MTRKQDRERWRRQSVVRAAGRSGSWRGPVPAVQQRRPCCSACPGCPAPAVFCPGRYHGRRAAGDPHTRAKPGRFPAPAACRSHAFRFSPGSGRPTGPEPVRAVPSRRPSRQEAARAFPGDLKPGTADVFDGTNAVRFSINRDPCPVQRPGPLSVARVAGRSAHIADSVLPVDDRFPVAGRHRTAESAEESIASWLLRNEQNSHPWGNSLSRERRELAR
jgi:hypothetical protein